MYKGKKILAIIPARGGSKGIPRKNIIDLCGKPLISYTISEGKKSKYIDYVLVSTDDDEIAEVAKEWGAEVPFKRPPELASDVAKTLDVVTHAITELSKQRNNFDVLILLQPTTPLRIVEDIDGAIEKFFEFNCESLVSVSEADTNPILMRTVKEDRLLPLLNGSSTCRRQDMPKYYQVNGCIYVNKIYEINDTTSFNDNIVPYIMEKSHSVDIDELSDLALAEYFLKKNK